MQKAHFRTDYARSALGDGEAPADPFDLFQTWFADAVREMPRDPNAMSLATVDPQGMPQVRIVLCKEFGPDGFVFYTNYESRKGADLAHRPDAALLFFWPPLERQVRIGGKVIRVTDAESDTYFQERPREARIGAWASPQSRPIADRATLESAVEAARQRFEGLEVPRPPHWGGYRLVPVQFEFWQGRPSRLHDRVIYRREDRDHAKADIPWNLERLAP